ncbi:MAG: hypothetical protein EA403_09085 [Spirochaetaceae bacterium]|nr:MAG: hypothetical protein EA403_09085 [Spirochaetaceae bacterium]
MQLTPFVETFLDKDNEIPGYARFSCSTRYMRFKSDQHQTPEDCRRIGHALGYNVENPNFMEKLRRRRRRLDAMDCDIPYEYLEEIEVNRDELETCIEADVALFAQEREKPRYPRKAIVRYAPALYGTFRFPEGTPEESAIRMLQKSDVARLSRMISYPQLLVVVLGPGHDVAPTYVWYPPEAEFRRNRIRIRSLPRSMGVTRLR